MINFEKILKRSFEIVKKYKFLWLFGLLSGGASFGMNNVNYLINSNNSSNNVDNLKDIIPSGGNIASIASARVKDLGQVLGEKVGPTSVGNVYLWVIILSAAVLLILALIYISITARGALIRSVNVIDDKELVNLSKAWSLGHKMFWRRLSFGLMLILIVFVPIAILITIPVLFGVFGMTLAAIISGIIVGLIIVFIAVYLALVLPVAERELFIAKKPIWKSLEHGYKLFHKYWSNFLLTYLIIFGFSIGLGVAMGLVALITGLLIFGIGMIFYLMASWAGITIWAILGLALFAVILVISGLANSFFSSVLTLAYKEVKNFAK